MPPDTFDPSLRGYGCPGQCGKGRLEYPASLVLAFGLLEGTIKIAKRIYGWLWLGDLQKRETGMVWCRELSIEQEDLQWRMTVRRRRKRRVGMNI